MKAGQASEHGLIQRHDRSRGLPYTVFLYIWGTQWVLSSCMDFFGQWQDVERWQQLTVWLALAASVAAFAASFRSSGNWQRRADQGGKAALPLLMITGAVSVLQYVQAVDSFFTPLLWSFVLAVGYALLGTWFGRPLIYMSLWLFTLTSVTAVWYPGFAAMLLGGFGGLSMIALAWMMRGWNSNTRTGGYRNEKQ